MRDKIPKRCAVGVRIKNIHGVSNLHFASCHCADLWDFVWFCPWHHSMFTDMALNQKRLLCSACCWPLVACESWQKDEKLSQLSSCSPSLITLLMTLTCLTSHFKIPWLLWTGLSLVVCLPWVCHGHCSCSLCVWVAWFTCDLKVRLCTGFICRLAKQAKSTSHIHSSDLPTTSSTSFPALFFMTFS